MADDDDFPERVKPSLTLAEVEQISARAAEEAVADMLRRMGIRNEEVESWRSLFAEVEPIDVRTAVQLTLERQKVRESFVSTLRSEGLKVAVQAAFVTFVLGLSVYVINGGGKK